MREETKSIIDSDSLPTLLYWITILNYFEFNLSDLELDDLKAVADESERCRIYLNIDREEIKTIYKNGKHIEINVIKQGLGITQDKVFPDVVYYYKQVLGVEQQKETLKLAKQVADMPEDNTPVEEWAENLAADLCR